MIRRRNPFEMMWQDMKDMRADRERMFHAVSSGKRLLPAGSTSDRMLPAIHGKFRVDVHEHDEDVMVVADLPGEETESPALDLINSRVLEITSTREKDTGEKAGGFYIRERMSGSMSRRVTLPADVTEDYAKARFRNGILEVRKKRGLCRRNHTLSSDKPEIPAFFTDVF